MWRVAAVVLFFIVVILAAAMISLAPRPAPFTGPSEGFLGGNDASLYYVTDNGRPVIIFLNGEWSSSSRSSSNTATRTSMTDVTLHAKGKPDVTLNWESTKPDIATVNGNAFALTGGSVVRVGPDGTIEQLPFAPPPGKPDPEYLKRLRTHFAGEVKPK